MAYYYISDETIKIQSVRLQAKKKTTTNQTNKPNKQQTERQNKTTNGKPKTWKREKTYHFYLFKWNSIQVYFAIAQSSAKQIHFIFISCKQYSLHPCFQFENKLGTASRWGFFRESHQPLLYTSNPHIIWESWASQPLRLLMISPAG